MALSAVQPGRPHPLGAQPQPGGVNFSVYASDAHRIELLLYDGADDAEPAQVIALETSAHRTWHYWHAFVPGLGPGQLYAWRAQGPFDPARGLRHDGDKVLLDPYGRAVALPRDWRRAAACLPGRNDAFAAKSVVAHDQAYDWEGDTPLRSPRCAAVIYEAHVRGFTRHPSSGVAAPWRGSYRGLVQKIPYLKDLGVTAVELMPVFQFDPHDAPPGLVNYWGYAPVSFFAPHAGYAPQASPLGVLDEFRDMVKALHRAGLEVILDVVYNHTAEGHDLGPVQSLRGLDNRTYYLLDEAGRPTNYSGCGNTLNANHAVVRRMIGDSLRYWVRVMHVDGFRFDLASILSRDEQGRPQPSAPVLWDIESDPVLSGTRIIAEAWDAAGLVQRGHFAGERWQEWNGTFRDEVRAFVRGDAGLAPRMAARLAGSPDLYVAAPTGARRSVNFVTSHDGFTLRDLVSYDHKHNESNREGNRDGPPDERGWNCGAEGPTSSAEVQALRQRQQRHLLAVLLLARGTPMLLMGDEIGRTQHGNSNAYCHDDETGWLDWAGLNSEASLHGFVRALLALRRRLEVVGQPLGQHDADTVPANAIPEPWHLGERSIGVSLRAPHSPWELHLALNGGAQPLRLARPGEQTWRQVLDTALDGPQAVTEDPTTAAVAGDVLEVAPRSAAAWASWRG